MNEFLVKGVKAISDSAGALYSARCHRNTNGTLWSVYVNGTAIADVDTPSEGFRLLSAIALLASTLSPLPTETK